MYPNGGNTALGYVALVNNVSGSDNVAVGSQALETNLSGSSNTAIGKRADVSLMEFPIRSYRKNFCNSFQYHSAGFRWQWFLSCNY
jgi:hypothetical protein